MGPLAHDSVVKALGLTPILIMACTRRASTRLRDSEMRHSKSIEKSTMEITLPPRIFRKDEDFPPSLPRLHRREEGSPLAQVSVLTIDEY